jgi:hypothetical protein
LIDTRITIFREADMDMSVTINPNAPERPPVPADTARAARAANSSDLDAGLEKVEALGELKRITAEVDPTSKPRPSPIWSAAGRARRCCSRHQGP